MSVENKVKEYNVVGTDPKGDYEHREKIIENVGSAQRQNLQRAVQFIWLVFGVIDALLGLRIFLLLIGANPASLFTQMIYNVTDLFMWPFANLVKSPSAGGLVLDISALIAMFVYALVAWVLASFVRILFARSSTRNVTVYEHRVNKKS